MAGLSAHVVDEIHGFKTVSTDLPLPKCQRLDDSYFSSSKETQSLPFEEICNVEQKSNFYNPKPQNNQVPMGG